MGRGPGRHLWRGQQAVCSPNAWCKPNRSQSEATRRPGCGSQECRGHVRARHLPRAAPKGEDKVRPREVRVPIPATWSRYCEAPVKSCLEKVRYRRSTQEVLPKHGPPSLLVTTTECVGRLPSPPPMQVPACCRGEGWFAVRTHPWCSQPWAEGTDDGNWWWRPLGGAWKGHRAWGAGCLMRAHYGG